MQELRDKVVALSDRQNAMQKAFGRIEAQQAANSHSVAALCTQQVQLQSSIEALPQRAAHSGSAASSPAKVLDRLGQLECSQKGLVASVADLRSNHTLSNGLEVTKTRDQLTELRQRMDNHETSQAAATAEMCPLLEGAVKRLDAQMADLHTEVTSLAEANGARLLTSSAVLTSRASAAEEAATAARAEAQSAAAAARAVDDRVSCLRNAMAELGGRMAMLQGSHQAENEAAKGQERLATAVKLLTEEVSAVTARQEQHHSAATADTAKIRAEILNVGGLQAESAQDIKLVETIQHSLQERIGEAQDQLKTVKATQKLHAEEQEEFMQSLRDGLAACGAAVSMLESYAASQAQLSAATEALAAQRAALDALASGLESEKQMLWSRLAELKESQQATAKQAGDLHCQVKAVNKDLQYVKACAQDARHGAQKAEQSAREVQEQLGAWLATMDSVAAEQELTATKVEQASECLESMAADQKVQQNVQLELACDVAAVQKLLKQLEAIAGAQHGALVKRQAEADTRICALHQQVQDCEKVAGAGVITQQLGGQLVAFKAAAGNLEARLSRQEADVQLVQDSVVELGEAMQVSVPHCTVI